MITGSVPISSVFTPSSSLKTGGGPASATSSNPNQLSDEERKVVEQMKARDREVRQHEQAHKTVGGPYAGAISYETETGPDGREYAVAGEVPIDVSPVSNNPEATIRKMDIVERAALAPAEPSPQDKAVAAQARTIKLQAQAQIQEQKQSGEDTNETKPKGIISEIKAAIEAYQKGEDPRDTQSKGDTISDSNTTIIIPPPVSLFA